MRSRVAFPLALAAAVALAAIGSMSVRTAPSADWSKIPARTVKLFFPGQSSHQWLRSKKHEGADEASMRGDSCISCHEGEEEEMGRNIAGAATLEPHPIEGKQGSIDLNVQVAHDGENLYMRFQWKTRNPHPGTAHPHWRFDGREWKQAGWPRLDERVWADEQPAIYEDRLSIMMDDRSVPMFAEQGCWLTCHDGMRDMPQLAEKGDVEAHPVLGKVLRKTDVRKYLPGSRLGDAAAWDETRSAEEIAKIKADGGFVDLMQWRGHRSRPVHMADDGYVLEYRLFDDGHNMFDMNWDTAALRPKYMYDSAKVGFRSRTMAQIRDPSQHSSLIVEENAVAFDPGAGWKEGDMIPQYYVTREGADGSAADNRDVAGTWKDGVWTVVWTRQLDTGHPKDDKIMKVGGVYTIGLAVHDDNIATRGHHVSFPLTLGIGVKADIQAVALK